MELVDQCQKSLYEKCKYKVKVWEHNFKKSNGRLPSKLDIKEAELEVRNAYKTYFQLKTAALEHSFRDVDGFNSDEEIVHTESNLKSYKNPIDNEFKGPLKKSTWGFHLNKTFAIKENICQVSEPASNLKLKITQKLSVGSKLMKRNPRKALSQVKNECSLSSTPSTSINSSSSVFSSSELIEPSNVCVIDPSSTILDIESPECFTSKKIKDVPIVQFKSYPANIQSVLDKNERKLNIQNIDPDWLVRVETSTNIDNELANKKLKLEFASDEDIIDNSDDESFNCPFVKRVKHNDGSISCFKNGEHQKSLNVPVSSKVDTSKDKIEQISFKYPTSLDVQIHNMIPKESIKKNYLNEINDQQGICKKSVLSKSSENRKSRNSNENFVRINLKKKIYARGKKTQKFSKYRKKWKNKQNILPGIEEDIVTKMVIPGKLLPLDAAGLTENEDLLVTLNQASGKDVVSQISTEKYLEDDESDEEMTLSEIKKLITGKNKGTTMESNYNEVLKSDIKTSKKLPLVKGATQKAKKKSCDTSRSRGVKRTRNNINNVAFCENTHTELMNQKQGENIFGLDDDSYLLSEALRLENAFLNTKVCPLYTTKEDGSLIDAPQEVYNALRLFGYETFREGQEKAVMRILSGKCTLVTLSTGSGKSLCYQLPAYLFRQKYKCITLVISPLISLMEDQIKCVPGILSAACLHGNQTKTQRDIVLKAVSSGEVNILMVSPETIMSSDSSYGFGSFKSKLPPIAFVCFDEAHCLSEWSHNFRPSYLLVCKILQDTLGVEVFLGLTATATKITRNSLINQLKITDGENGIIKDTPIPPNLSLSVSKDPNKDQALLGLLLSKPFIDFRSIIVYCLRRDECEKVASFLRTTLKDHFPIANSKKTKNMSSQAEPYHAGLSASRRKAIQKAFISGELRIIVATIAFGMGINKCDIRCVIHYNMPAKFESYVQEIGRAGRDDRLAHCHVFLDKEKGDIFQHSRHIYGNSVDRFIIRKLLRKVFPSCNCKGTCTKHEVIFSMDSTVQELDVAKEIIATLLCYLELHENQYIRILKPCYGKCKILSYGGRDLINKEAQSCQPLRIALEILQNDDNNSNSIEFPILTVATAMNCDTGMCKGILKNLEWINISGQPKRSSLTVEFFDLSFHLLSPGNLPDKALDEVLDSLYQKVLEQENTSYSQLIHFNRTLAKYSLATFENCLTDIEEKSELLKQDIREYFESDEQLKRVCIPEISEEDKSAILNDIRSMVSRHHDRNFTGRSIAKIFHGIPSPNVPAYVWGRTGFWRKYLQIHFNTICKIATMELVKM